MALLEISDLSKKFGTRQIIRNLSLSVEAGGIFGFLGPNGAGKTTTIRLITGILTPTSGAVSVAGFDLARDPLEAKRRIGYIPDSPFLYPKLTGWEHMELAADLYGEGDFRRRAEDLLERFDLLSRSGDFVDSYSFGMRQKLSIAMAVLHAPELVIVDEPLIGLDPPAARSVKELFLEETRRGAAVFMSTHLLEIAEALCDTVAILDRGELVAEGNLDLILAARTARLEAVFLRLLADRREEGTEERRRWEALATAAEKAIR